MKKKLLCLLLSVLMLLSVALTACGKKDDEEALDDITDKASASAVTLSMYLMSEEPVSAEQEKLIEEAVNNITKAKFKVKLDLTFLTPNEYYTVLEENLELQAENAYLYNTDEEEVAQTEPETEKDELGIETLKYPALRENQVDIFYFSGYDKYKTYADNEYLHMLNEAVDGESKALKSYIAPALLEYTKSVNDGIYALPNNRALGEYTYLLLNKTVLDEMYYDTVNSEFTSLTCDNVRDILAYVADINTNPNANSALAGKYVPLHSFTGEIDVLNYQYWGVDENGLLSNKFSLLGGSINPAWSYKTKNAYSEVKSIFEDEAFTSQYAILEQYRQLGYYNEAAVNAEDPAQKKDFAVGYIKGGKEIETLYGDKYEVVPVAMPTLYTQDLYENMYGVSAYTVDLNRSMSVLTYLNTNEEFRNLIAYGIEGEHYELVETTVVNDDGSETVYKQVKAAPNNTYKMDVNKTGNVLLAYTTVDQDPLLREYAKDQNRDVKPSYTMGLQVDYDGLEVNMEYFHGIAAASAQAFETMKTQSQDLQTVQDSIGTIKINTNTTLAIGLQFMKDQTKAVGMFAGDTRCSFAYMYYTWLTDNGIYVEESENPQD